MSGNYMPSFPAVCTIRYACGHEEEQPLYCNTEERAKELDGGTFGVGNLWDYRQGTPCPPCNRAMIDLVT